MIEVRSKAPQKSPAPLLSKTNGVPDVELMGQTPGRWRYGDDRWSRVPIAVAVAVPQLADLPSSVSVSTFVQPLQYTPDINASLSNAKVAQIPVNIGRGRNLANMGQIFEISQLDRAPSPLMQPAPVFPYSLKSTISEARVVVEFIVDSNGEVVAPSVVSSTHEGFNENALVGVSKWKFKPGMKAGKRVNTRVRAPINFFVTDDT